MALDLNKIDLNSLQGAPEESPLIPDQKSPLQATLTEAVKVNPDSQVKLQKLSRDSGIPEFAVEGNPAEVETSLKLSQIDLDSMVKRSPNTSEFLSDWQNASIAHDDIDILEELEGLFRFGRTFENVGETTKIGFQEQAAGLLLRGADNTADKIVDLIPPSALPLGIADHSYQLSYQLADRMGIQTDEELVQAKQEATDNIIGEIKQLQERRKELTPDDLNTLEQGVRAGIESLMNMAPGVGLTVLTGGRAAPLLATIGAQTFGQSYGTARAEGEDPSTSAWYAGIDAAIEVGTEILPVGTLERILTGQARGQLTKEALRFAVREMGTEQLATLGQSLNAYAFGLDEELENAESLDEMIQIQLQRQAVTAIATVVAGGAQITAANTVRKSIEALTSQTDRQTGQGAAEQQRIDDINAAAGSSKLKQRDPEAFRQFLEQADADQNSSVYIDGVQAALYLQSKSRKEIDADPALQKLEAQAREAASLGGDVVIPVADFATDLANTEHFDALREHMTLSAESVSPFRSEQVRQETENYVQSLVEEAEQNASDYVQAQEIYESVRAQLIDTGQVSDQVAKVSAQVVPAWATVYARKNGITVQEAFQRSGLTITGPQTGRMDELTGAQVLTEMPNIQDEQVLQQRLEYQIEHTPMSVEGGASTLDDLTGAFGEDIYDIRNALQFFGTGDSRERAVVRQMQKLRGKPDAEVTIYRGVPAEAAEINPGDWVTLSKEAAQDYADQHDDGKVISKKVKASEVTSWSDSLLEFGYYPEDQEQFAQFAGTAATTADMPQLQRAKDMESKGLGNQAIKRETGWFRGVDGRWRFEIADDKARLTDDPSGHMSLAEAMYHPELFTAYPDLEKVTVAFTDMDGDRGSFSPDTDTVRISSSMDRDQMLSTLLHEVQHAIQFKEGFAIGGSPSQEFSDAVKRALGDMAAGERQRVEGWVRINQAKVQAAGATAQLARNAVKYQSAQRLIDYSQRDKPSGVFRLIKNELQWIYGEEFYGNRAANDIQRKFYDIPKRGPKRQEAIRDLAFEGAQFILDSIPSNQRQAFKDDERTLNGMVKALERQASKARKELDPLRELESRATRAGDVAESTKFKTSFDVYRSLAGEIEARTTQARQRLTAEERRIRSVRMDMDVAPDEAIVVFGSMEIAAPETMMSATEQTEPEQARGYYNPANSMIRLTESADPSTFLHEFAHFMYEMELKAGSETVDQIHSWFKRNATEVAKEAAEYAPGESINDLDVLNYLETGRTGSQEKDAGIRRAVHEQFARGFETYLMEGKAPSIELRNAFRTIARLLVEVYRRIRGDLKVNLDNEMRQVFDRLLATEEQIQAAEARAKYAPLFNDAAMARMTNEEWQDYQKRQQRVKDVQSETLRDKLIAELTRQTKAWWKEEKRDVADEVERDLRTERVYTARRVLKHGRAAGASDQVDIGQTRASIKEMTKQISELEKSPKMRGEIARMGGLNRASFEAEGIDPVDFKLKSSVFGKPLFPRTGGMTADDLAEKLNEIDYQGGGLSANDALNIVNDLMVSDFFVDPTVDAQIESLEQSIRDAESAVEDAELQSRMATVKLDRAAVKEMVGEQVTDKRGRTFTRVPPALNGMHEPGGTGLHPDEAAALFDYSSGSEMLADLMSAPSLRDAVESRAEQIMLERHGDILNDGTIEQQADEAVQSEERGRFLLHELKILSRNTSASAFERQAIKQLAEDRIAKLSFREINPGKYRKAEIKAAQEASRMLAEGNREGAAQAKQRQVVNYFLSIAATDAKNGVTKIVDRMARYNKKSVREEIQKAGNEYWEQLQKILERFEFRKGATLRQVEQINTDINTWMRNRIDQDGDALVLTPVVLNESYVTHWKNVPYGELQGVSDSVRNIEHVARYSNKITRMQEEVDFKELVQKWITSIDNKVKTRFKSQRTDVAEGRNWDRWSMAQMTKIPYMASWLDGGERAGLSHQILVQPFTDAYNAELQMWKEVGNPVLRMIENRSKADIKRHNRKIFIPEIKDENNDGNLFGHQIIAVALNTGNQSNLRKMLLGEGWANPEFEAEISFDNPKLQAVLKHMTRSDWQLVQNIWDQMELLYPQLAEVHRRTTGLTPPKVEATPIKIEIDGETVEMRGGYYPVKYDPNRSQRAQENEDRLNAETESMFSNNMSIQASVNAGATNERTGYYAPIRLSLDVVPAHFQETIHYITHHDAVRETNKLIRNPAVAKTITEKLGKEEFAQLRPWLNDIAKDGREAPTKMYWDSILQRLRFGVTLGAMGFKASTGLMQLLGLSNTVAEVGLSPVMQSVRSILGSTTTMRQAWDFAKDNSKVLEHRTQTMDREIKNAMKRIEGKRGMLAAVQEASMKHIALIQTYMVDLPSWHAAYIKAMKEYGDEQRAYQYADWVIENIQGSGVTKDMARIMRGQSETGRMFTMFMTFFSSLWNMERDLVKGARSGIYSRTTVAAKIAFIFFIPVFLEMLMRGEFGGDEDDDESKLQTYLTKTALYPVQSVPFVRDVANAVGGDFGYNITPLQQILEQGTQTIPELLTRPFTDEEITKGQVKGATKFIGAAVGIPGTAQAWATGEHLYDVTVEGEDLTMRELLFGPKKD